MEGCKVGDDWQTDVLSWAQGSLLVNQRVGKSRNCSLSQELRSIGETVPISCQAKTAFISGISTKFRAQPPVC